MKDRYIPEGQHLTGKNRRGASHTKIGVRERAKEIMGE